MNCNLARMLLAFPKADLAAEDRAGLHAHVAGCPHCARAASAESALHIAFAAAMQSVPVPAGLHAKLLRDGFAVRGAKHRRTLYRWSAMAAAVLLAISVGFGGYLHTRPEIDTGAEAFRVEQEWEGRSGPVREWLVAQDLPESLPVEFDYRHYVAHGWGELAGRRVPMVVFHGQFTNAFGVVETHTARVYIADSTTFKNIDKLGDAQSSLVRLTVKFDPARPKLAYVIVFTSETLDPFLKRFKAPDA